MRIGIVGGGLMGMAAAQRLSSAGHAVDVYERNEQVGGLATWHDFGRFFWDKFYHVVLPTDRNLISFLDAIGLAGELRWETTRTGFFVDRKLHSVSSGIEYLRFPPLSLWSKFRLATAILYCSRIKDWKRLERQRVDDWLIKVSGRKTYEKLWKPLLLAKLGPSYQRVSAVFIWSYIKRMFGARDGSAQKEQLGYVRGGYRRVFERLVELIENSGGTVRTGSIVESLSGLESGVSLTVNGERIEYDKVICTGPTNVLQDVLGEGLIETLRSGESVEYLGVVCVVLITRRPLTPFYVLNIADDRVPFTGVIGMSNVVDPAETGGNFITYLPKYVLSTDEFLKSSNEEIEKDFLSGLSIMYPDLHRSDIVSVHINRAFKVQPLQVLNYSEIVPDTRTLHPDLFVLNTSQFVNNTLNNNEVIRAVDDFLRQHEKAFELPPKTARLAPNSVRADRRIET